MCGLCRTEAGDREGATFLCVEIHLPAVLNFQFQLAVSFLSGRVHPLPLLKALLFFFHRSVFPARRIPFLTSHFLTLVLSSHHTEGSSSFNLISYTGQFSPCFSFTAALCLHKTRGGCNSALPLESRCALIFKYNAHLEGRLGFPQTLCTTLEIFR